MSSRSLSDVQTRTEAGNVLKNDPSEFIGEVIFKIID